MMGRKLILPRRKILRAALCAAPFVLLSKPSKAWFPHGVASTVDTLLVVVAGDSNTGSGQFFNATYDTTRPNLYQFLHGHTTALAQEPLDMISPAGANEVGSTTRLCQFLIDNGHVPAGVVRIVMLPTGWGGTGLSLAAGNTGYWNVAGSRQALDGVAGSITNGSAAGFNGLYGMINAAKATYPNNKIWFFNWIEGANDGSWVSPNWTNAMIALWAEVRGVYADAINAPILVTGVPPDKYNQYLGNVNNYHMLGEQAAIGSSVSKAYYVDPSSPTVLHSYLGNAFIHFNAAAARGGVTNFNTSGYAWSSGATYNTVAVGAGDNNVAVGSDNYLYTTLIDGNIGNDPSGNAFPAKWRQNYSATETISDSDCLAYRQYQALLSAGF